MSSLFMGAMPALAWTSAQKSAVLNSCIESAMKVGAPDRSIARSYCNCVVYATSRRYTADQFAKNPQSVLVELQKNGTIKRCGDQAMANSTVWTQAHIKGEQDACTNNLLKSSQNRISRAQATNFCQCIVRELRTRYTPAQTTKNPTKILSELQKAGVMNRCRAGAGIS